MGSFRVGERNLVGRAKINGEEGTTGWLRGKKLAVNPLKVGGYENSPFGWFYRGSNLGGAEFFFLSA